MLRATIEKHKKTWAYLLNREDDTKWPQKNKDGRQELEIRLGSEHISFEVRQQQLLNSGPCSSF
jgi:hypothetical protein